MAHIWLLPRMAGWRWMCTMAHHGAPWRSHFSGTSSNSTWPVLACLISGKVIYTHTYMYPFIIYIYIYTKCRIFLWRGWITIGTPIGRWQAGSHPRNLGWWVHPITIGLYKPTYHTYHKGELSHDCDSWVFSNQELLLFFPLRSSVERMPPVFS